MDCHSSYLSFRTLSGYLSLFLLMLLSVPLQGAITISGSNPVPCGPVAGYFLVDFTISDLPELEENPDFYGEGVNSRYAIFLYFGDGTHVELIVAAEQSSTTCQHLYKGVPSTPANFDVRAEISSVYLPADAGDDDDTEMVRSETEIVDYSYNREFPESATGSCSVCETNEDDDHLAGRKAYPNTSSPDETGWVERIRDAVPGDVFTLAIQYGFDICQTDLPPMEIDFDPDLFSLNWSSQGVNTSIPGKVSFNFPSDPLGDITDKKLYLSFDVSPSAELQDLYKFTINRPYDNRDACDGKATPNDTDVEVADRLVSGHDPNSKKVYPAFFAGSGPIELEYLISFYNDGKDPVHSIMIKDVLDDQLDYTTIREVKFWTAKDPTPHSPLEIASESSIADKTFRWHIDPLLPVEGLLPIKNNEVKKTDWAYLSFVVDTKADIAIGKCIPNTAEIFFYYPTEAHRNFIEETQACRSCCQRKVQAYEPLGLNKDAEKVIRIVEAPDHFQKNSQGQFYFTDENFTSAQIIFQECRIDENNRWHCDATQSMVFCNALSSSLLCDATPPPPPPPFNIWWLILLLLITALLIYLAYRRTPPTP
ncbi:MAG: hypothetical protein AB8H47_28620 [Bacteroidia bacterium]